MNIKIWRYRISTLRKDLKQIFLFALSSVLIIDLWLIKIPEFFDYGAELGSIYYKLCLAYITAFIFYFLNIHLQSEKNKVKLFRYINNKFGNIDFLNICLICSLRIANKQEPNPNQNTNETEIEELCKGINPSQSFFLSMPYNSTFNHWTECINFLSKEYKVIIQELLIVRDIIDTDLIVLLTDIDEYLDRLNLSKGSMLGNEDITVYQKEIWKLISSTNELFKVLRNKYKYHQIESNENYLKNKSKQNEV